jgi:hypothetical protein
VSSGGVQEMYIELWLESFWILTGLFGADGKEEITRAIVGDHFELPYALTALILNLYF